MDHQQLKAADEGDRGYQISGTTENAQNLPAGSTLWMIAQGDQGTFYPFNIDIQPNGSWVIPANVAQFGPKGFLQKAIDFELMVCPADSVQAKPLWEHVRKGAADQDPTMLELPPGMESNCYQPISVSRVK